MGAYNGAISHGWDAASAGQTWIGVELDN